MGRGRFLGVPYDWRRPTLRRLLGEVWNPRERRMLVPKAFGWASGSIFTRSCGGCFDAERFT